MPDLILDRVRQIIATIFNVPVDDVSPDSSPETIANWDSMGHLMLILELEQEFNVQLLPEQVEQMKTVSSVVSVLEAAVGGL